MRNKKKHSTNQVFWKNGHRHIQAVRCWIAKSEKYLVESMEETFLLHSFMVHLSPNCSVTEVRPSIMMKMGPSIIKVIPSIIEGMPSSIERMPPIIKVISPVEFMLSYVMSTILKSLRTGAIIVPRLCPLFRFRWIWKLVWNRWMGWWL